MECHILPANSLLSLFFSPLTMLRYAVRLPVQPETSSAYSKWPYSKCMGPYSKCMGPYSKTKVLGLALKTLFPEERLSSAKQILRFYILSAGPSL